MDVVDTALSNFRFAGTLYSAWCTNRPPWSIQLGAIGGVHLHAVRSGKAVVRRKDGEAVEMEAGDFTVLPHGDSHDVLDSAASKSRPAAELLAGQRATTPFLVHLGAGDSTPSQLVCAAFACPAGPRHPVLACLPRVIHLKASETHSLEPLLVLSEREMNFPQPATPAVLARIAEILLVETIRAYLKTLGPEQDGLLGALRDPRIGIVLKAIHGDLARRWNIEELARAAGMSRTALAVTFAKTVGMPVQAYTRGSGSRRPQVCWKAAEARRLRASPNMSATAPRPRLRALSCARWERHRRSSVKASARTAPERAVMRIERPVMADGSGLVR